MQLLDTLADKRQLLRLSFADATHIAAGHYLQLGAQRLPLLRHDAHRASVDVVIAPNTITDLTTAKIAGQAIDLSQLQHCCVITRGDGIFRALHALFLLPSAQRKLVSVIAVFDEALPFHPCPSRVYAAQLPAHVIAALPLLEDWGVFNRIVHATAPGCFDGAVEDLCRGFPFADTVLHLD